RGLALAVEVHCGAEFHALNLEPSRHRRFWRLRRLVETKPSDDEPESTPQRCGAFSAGDGASRPGRATRLLPGLRAGLERPQLAFALELRPVNPVQVHEPRRELQRILIRLELADRVAADDLFRLGERPVVHGDLSLREPDALAFRGGLEPGRV